MAEVASVTGPGGSPRAMRPVTRAIRPSRPRTESVKGYDAGASKTTTVARNPAASAAGLRGRNRVRAREVDRREAHLDRRPISAAPAETVPRVGDAHQRALGSPLDDVEGEPRPGQKATRFRSGRGRDRFRSRLVRLDDPV